jgi:hypothetical protein
VQAARNHQVQNEPQVVLDTNTDPFAKPSQPGYLPALHTGDWRHGGAQQKRTRESDPLYGSALNSLLESLNVDGDVGQFRH